MHRAVMVIPWTVYRREPNGSETYLGVVEADDGKMALVLAQPLRLVGEDPASLGVRPWWGSGR